MKIKIMHRLFIVVLICSGTILAIGPQWSQTDWSGGDGQTNWSDTTMYESDDGQAENNYPAGDLKIRNKVNTGDGSDGALTVSTVNTVINHYAYLTSNTTSGNILNISNGTNFQNGDEILIIQMHNTDSATPGRYEFKRISSGGGTNTLILDSNVTNSYYSSRASVTDTVADIPGSGLSTNNVYQDSNSVITQIVRVPQYTSVMVNSGASIIPDYWNGIQGGIVVFRSRGKVEVSNLGAIHADGYGYRGGTHGGSDGYRGEGWRGGNPMGGYNNATLDRRVQKYGGGGTYVNGAGGGYGTAGTVGDTYGGRPATAGLSYGDSQLARMFPGGAGGGGHPNAGRPHGGNGGGIVHITSDTIILSGSGYISSDGADGYPVAADQGQWGGGGGAGGSIFLTAITMSLGTNLVHAAGGIAHDGINGSGDGGDGGLGRIRLDYSNLTGVVSIPSPYTGGVGYADTAYLISSIYDISDSSNGLYKVNWNQSLVANSNITIKVRSSSSSTMSGASEWSSVDTIIADNVNVKGNAGLTIGERYIQYRIDLFGDGNSTPTFEDITVELNVAPNSFNLTLPTSGSENNITPVLDWEDATDNNSGSASSYIVEIDDDNDFSSLVHRQEGLATSIYAVDSSDGLQGHMTYYWRVYAKDDYPDSSASIDTFSFTTENNAPDQFNLIAPLNGSENNVTPLLQWNKPNDIDPLDNVFTYYVELDDDSDFSTPLFVTSVLSDTSYQVTLADSLKGHMTYYWRVRAIDSYPDTTISADTFYLTTEDNPPYPFNLLSPLSGSEVSITPLLRWSETSDIDPLDNSFTYVVEVDDDPDFSSLTIRTTVISDTMYQVTSGDSLQDNTTYYWRVWGRDNYPDSTLSIDTFVIFTDMGNNVPSLPTPLFPIPNSECSLNDSLFWTRNDIDPGDTLRYNIRLSDNVSFSNIVASKNDWLGNFISLSDLDNSDSLIDDGIYFWQVEAHDPDAASSGYTAGTDSIYFNKINDKPSLPFSLFPDSATTLGPNDYLKWKVTDGDSLGLTPDVLNYTVIVDNNSDYSSPVGITTGIIQDSIKVISLLNSANLLDNTKYYWKVFAIDNHGLIGDTTLGITHFWFNNSNGAPTTPTGLLPVASTNIGPEDSIKWTASSDSDPYDKITYVVEVASDNSFASIISIDSIEGISLQFNEISNYVNFQTSSTYYWRVKAFDSQGAESGWAGGSAQSLVFQSTTPSIPTPISPLKDATYFPSENISWGASQDSDAGALDSLLYVLQLSSYETFSEVIDIDTVNGLNKVLQDIDNYAVFIDNSRYFWRVGVFDNHGAFSGWSNPGSFILDKSNNPPTTPSIIQPIDTAVVFSDTLFRWKMSTDPDPENSITYKIIGSCDSLFLDTVCITEGISDTSISLDLLNSSNVFIPSDTSLPDTFGFKDDQYYYWKIAAVDNRNASSPYSVEEYFYVNLVDDTPGVVTSLKPDFSAITFPTEILKWQCFYKIELGDTTKYLVETSLDSFSTIYGVDTLVNDTFVQLRNLSRIDSVSDETIIYWRIKSFDIAGNSFGYSTIASLFYSISNTAPTPVTGLWPIDSIQPLLPTDTLSWSVSKDLEKDSIFYDIRISDSLLDTSAADTLYTVRVNDLYANHQVINMISDGYNNMIHNKVYYWRIRAFDEHNFQTPWTSEGIFRFTGTVATAPTKLIPSDSSELSVNGVLNWSKCIDSDPGPIDTLRYVVFIFNDQSFSDTVSRDTVILDTIITIKELNGVNSLQDDKYYYWKVASMDVHGTSNPSVSYGSFYFNRSNSAPNTPDSLQPANLVSRRPFQPLSWIGSDPDQDDSLVYNIELGSDTLFTIPLAVINNYSNNKISLDRFTNYQQILKGDSTYFWRVKATDLDGEKSSWSKVSSFIYDEKDNIATAPVIISPISGSIILYDDTLIWKNSTDEDDTLLTYHIDIAYDSGFSQIGASVDNIIGSADSITSISLSSLSQIDSLKKDTLLYFRVYAKSRVDTLWIPGNSSEIWNLWYVSNIKAGEKDITSFTVVTPKVTGSIGNIAFSIDSSVQIIFPDSSVTVPVGVKISKLPILTTVDPADSTSSPSSDTLINKLTEIAIKANKYAKGNERIYDVKENTFLVQMNTLSGNNPVGLLDSVLFEMTYHDTDNSGFVDGEERIPVSALSLFKLNILEERWELVSEQMRVSQGEGISEFRKRKVDARNNSIQTVTEEFEVYSILAYRVMSKPFSNFKVYPNPINTSRLSSDFATISYWLLDTADVEIRIYSPTGGLVWNKHIAPGDEGSFSENENEIRVLWDVRNNKSRLLANGMYTVKIRVKPVTGGVYNRKQYIGIIK